MQEVEVLGVGDYIYDLWEVDYLYLFFVYEQVVCGQVVVGEFGGGEDLYQVDYLCVVFLQFGVVVLYLCELWCGDVVCIVEEFYQYFGFVYLYGVGDGGVEFLYLVQCFEFGE